MNAPAAAKPWDDRRQIWRNYLGRRMYTVTDAGYYIYRDWMMRRTLYRWKKDANLDVRTALDFGCGTGDTAIYLAKLCPGAAVLGVDISPFMIEKAREKQRAEDRITFMESTGNLAGADPCDLIVTAMVLQHNDDDAVRNIFRMFARLLTPNGRVFVMESVVPAEHEKAEPSYIARSGAHYESLMNECGLEVERSYLLSSPVYRRIAPFARRFAESIAAEAVSPRARMILIDIACTPAVIATCATDSVLSRDAGWGYKLWWLKHEQRRDSCPAHST